MQGYRSVYREWFDNQIDGKAPGNIFTLTEPNNQGREGYFPDYIQLPTALSAIPEIQTGSSSNSRFSTFEELPSYDSVVEETPNISLPVDTIITPENDFGAGYVVDEGKIVLVDKDY